MSVPITRPSSGHLGGLTNGLNVDVVYLDFAKAFDKVDHEILLVKLRRLGIQGLLLCWMRSFLTARVQYVAVEGACSAESSVISGVAQGSVLGPVLFLIHIADINERILYSTVRSFADDTRVTKSIKSDADCACLQTDLNSIYEWSVTNNMTFNGDKFELLRYVVSGEPVEFCYKTPNGSTINRTSKTTDLGLVMVWWMLPPSPNKSKK